MLHPAVFIIIFSSTCKQILCKASNYKCKKHQMNGDVWLHHAKIERRSVLSKVIVQSQVARRVEEVGMGLCMIVLSLC